MPDLTRIILSGGLGPIEFGASVDDVKRFLGPPAGTGSSNEFIDIDVDEPEFILHWFRPIEDDLPNKPWAAPPAASERHCRALNLRFESKNGLDQLTRIGSDSHSLKFLGVQICGNDEVRVFDHLERNGIKFIGSAPAGGMDFIAFSNGLQLWSRKSIVYMVGWFAKHGPEEVPVG